MDMGFSRRAAQPETLLGLLRLAEMCARVVIMTSRNDALRLTLGMPVVREFEVQKMYG
jgi:hypothetical protein